ncbi:Flp pilus assembly protein CpaB [Vibrio sp. Isolate25]|uniref:Flp pilus assembly protein CpaB n=1 Tax=Vibrio TaxID=662 RepID=UPI001EFEA84D|nr:MULTISPECIES: Flp pilus assembly protein CpaB [Vibrio]MCG9598841.1 Flp pilus assembly protein CpaB [Vibrio sp. Isolate25]MCG9680790.1 Flp pilus assembly protein CpaB [Vibrio sp. Isolate24]MCG9683343.1 Flp pilus assembly protein CpaB [Vibrio sp. Isolate23]USD33061.1 Flp pilus assembly protein CpaB [Vibrio sp. SCSIO 43186]USD46130.1 Flp pilus assembly protein CpaB [Vibrio sp. SCSIO 43145]
MSRNQVILLFLLSIAFGLGAVFFAKQWMDRQMQPQTEVEVVEREPVIVSTQEILAGSVIEEQHITTKLLEKAWRDEFQFSNAEDLVGQVVATNIYPGEIVTTHRLARPGEGSTLASLIPENKRAVTIRVNDVIGVAGFLLPGNKVDVLNTIKYSSTSASTVTVLKEIKVLAVDQTAKTKENKPIIVRAVTLEVSPREAEKLLSAQSKGEIQLALRNPHEEEKVVKRYVAPSVTIIKGTESRNIRVKD